MLDSTSSEPSAPLAGAPPLRTSITRPRAGTVVLAVEGEVDALTVPPLDAAMQEMLVDPAGHVLVVDLSGVTFLASSGLAVLLRAASRAAGRDLRVRLVAGSRAVRRPLEVTGSDQLFDMYENVQEALSTGS